jgi:hypothetical protein
MAGARSSLGYLTLPSNSWDEPKMPLLFRFSGLLLKFKLQSDSIRIVRVGSLKIHIAFSVFSLYALFFRWANRSRAGK